MQQRIHLCRSQVIRLGQAYPHLGQGAFSGNTTLHIHRRFFSSFFMIDFSLSSIPASPHPLKHRHSLKTRVHELYERGVELGGGGGHLEGRFLIKKSLNSLRFSSPHISTVWAGMKPASLTEIGDTAGCVISSTGVPSHRFSRAIDHPRSTISLLILV